ncbi:hypothetical protein SISNIDRAFT_489595 [Sistotremastrum niveocremeum HHB9708]|uniref:Uncharacterized protein n=1 Tax=Sistotremastrum niveocremeum HHB9708 TaxID=1314777 RepID=A0A164PQ50_9AGAM|nr:hypothetical protein SISNIDRAFT_489595 [Sistotremastrum niveocremeum HHB9708]
MLTGNRTGSYQSQAKTEKVQSQPDFQTLIKAVARIEIRPHNPQDDYTYAQLRHCAVWHFQSKKIKVSKKHKETDSDSSGSSDSAEDSDEESSESSSEEEDEKRKKPKHRKAETSVKREEEDTRSLFRDLVAQMQHNQEQQSRAMKEERREMAQTLAAINSKINNTTGRDVPTINPHSYN